MNGYGTTRAVSDMFGQQLARWAWTMMAGLLTDMITTVK